MPFNIVIYNLFSDSSKGPDIYGTEPWHFYLRNLLINFNLWLLLSTLAYPLLVIHDSVLKRRPVLPRSHFSGFILTSPFYIWLALFTLQPHKEERFMYPAYPSLALNASISLHTLLLLLSGGSSGNARDGDSAGNYPDIDRVQRVVKRIPSIFKLLAVLTFIILTSTLGLLRSLGLATAYNAPLSIYRPLFQSSQGSMEPRSNSTQSLCLGKEWYRFPSSYHIPQNFRARFVKSEFSGLLPGPFAEPPSVQQSTSSSPRIPIGLPASLPGTYMIPPGMNDENIEDLGKYTPLSECDFLVDSTFPESTTPTLLEPDYFKDTKTWEKVLCKPFLDAQSTAYVARLFWMPEWEWLPRVARRHWGSYCLLKRRTES